MQNQLKNELQNIISGKGKVRYGTIIQAIACYLNDGAQTSPKAQRGEQIKEQERKNLEEFIFENNLWIEHLDLSQFVSSGAEQKVYLKDAEHVVKLNDAIYYNSWRDYFYNLIFHNYFFPDTAYELIGFVKEDNVLFAAVSQAFVIITGPTSLDNVKSFLESNGFLNKKNNDYYNPELGIIIEDLHDENVLMKEGMLYFIDTVFYATEKFWE